MVCHYTADYQSGMHPPLFQLFMSTQRDKGRPFPSLVAMVAWDTSPRLFSLKGHLEIAGQHTAEAAENKLVIKAKMGA